MSELGLPERSPRVRFRHPVRVVPLGVEGPPRAYRLLATNISEKGMFLRMPTPLPQGTQVALSLEASGRVLPFARGEVVWQSSPDAVPSATAAPLPGFGVRFTGYLHPRSEELVTFLVGALDRGTPLTLPPPVPRWRARFGMALAAALGVAILLAGVGLVIVLRRSGGALTPPPLVQAGAKPIAPPPLVEAKVDSPLAVAAQAVTGREDLERAEAEAPVRNEASDAVAGPALAAVAAPPEGSPAAGSDAPSPEGGSRAAGAPPARSAASPAAPVAIDSLAPDAIEPAAGSRVRAASPAPAAPRALPVPPAAGPARPGVVGTSAPPSSAPGVKAARTLQLPSGAVASLRWERSGHALVVEATLRGGGKMKGLLLLQSPSRLVFDVKGGVPKRSYTLTAPGTDVARVRVGRQGDATRVVVDLAFAPKSSRLKGAIATLSD